MSKKDINITNLLLLLILLITISVTVILGIAGTQTGVAALPAPYQQMFDVPDLPVAAVELKQGLLTNSMLEVDLVDNLASVDSLRSGLGYGAQDVNAVAVSALLGVLGLTDLAV